MTDKRSVALAALVLMGWLLLAGRAYAASSALCSTRAGCTAHEAPELAKKAGKETNDGLLDQVGLGSLEELPWSTMPLALALSALIGAVGGFVYSGLVGPSESTKKEPL